MYIYPKNRRKKGYTLAELLTVVAIITILGAISTVGVVNYYKYLKQMEVDQAAKEIYIAAQNHLTYADSTGQLLNTTELGQRIQTKPSDMSQGEWESNKDSYYYIAYNRDTKEILKNTILKDILPLGSIDGVVRESGSYIIEYNIKTATIYGVFYAKEGRLTWADEINEFLPGEKYRDSAKNRMKYTNSSGKLHLGYYGGSGVTIPKLENIEKPSLEILNEDRLIVKITDNNESNKVKTIISLEVKGVESGKSKILDLPINEVARVVKKKRGAEFNNWEVKKENKKTVYTLILDDITSKNGHFSEIFENFTPGENISITAHCVGKDILTPIVKSKTKTTNSLFKSVLNNTANIVSIRHLENLDARISGLKSSIKHASQYNDIDYTQFIANTASNVIYEKDGTKAITDSFYSISNNELISYNGNKFKLLNLSIKGQINAGLFSRVGKNGNLSILNLSLINPKVKGIDTAGSFVGLAEGDITIEDSSVIGKNSRVSAQGERPSAGGIIGECSNGSKLRVKNTFSTALVSIIADKGEGKSNQYAWAGGLIGRLYYLNQGSLIENCYVGGRTQNGGEYNPTACNVTAVVKNGRIGNVGGFVGKINQYNISKKVKIKNCYTTASVSGEGNSMINVGGLIGHANNTTIDSSYSTGLVKSNKKKTLGSFIGKVDKNVGTENNKNFALLGVNTSLVHLIGNDEDSSLASLSSEEKIRNGQAKCKLAYPYDKDLKNNEFKLRVVTGNTHYGDWPEGSTKVTVIKKINNKTDEKIDFEKLKNQKAYFVLINTTKHKRYKLDYNSFVKNTDGSYIASIALPGEEFSPTDKFTFNEAKEEVENIYSKKSFKVKKNNKEIATGIDTVSFNIVKDDKVEIETENEYSKLARVDFQYKDPSTGLMENIETKEFKLDGNITPPSASRVKILNGNVFKGIWVLEEDKNIRINEEGYLLDASNNPTSNKYIIKKNKLVFTAEYEKIPVISLNYGVIKDGKFISVIDDSIYQVKKGTPFKAEIKIKNVLTSKHKFLKVLENGNTVGNGVTVKDKVLKFDIKNIQKDHEYQVVIEGTDVKYGMKYVFLNSQGNSINNLSYSENGQEVVVEGVKYKGAVIDSNMLIEGVVGMFTNVKKQNVPNPPIGFNDPIWTNVKVEEGIGNKPKTYVYIIYSREKYNVNYNLEGGKSHDGNILIPRIQAEYGSSVVLENPPTKKGYNFKGWKVEDSKGNEKSINGNSFTMPEDDVMITAKWEEKKIANYTIEFYVQKFSDRPGLNNADKKYDYYKSEVIENKNVGTRPNLAYDYSGFNDASQILNNKHFEYNQVNTENGLNDVRIKPDGTTIAKVYFDRETVTISFVYDNNKEEWENNLEAANAANNLGGNLVYGYHFNTESSRTYLNEPEKLGWYYWRRGKYIKYTEDLNLADSEELYYRYYEPVWPHIHKYVKTTVAGYKKYLWRWGRGGPFRWWAFGYYSRTDNKNAVEYKGLYGAPFIQKGSDYYKFIWNNSKNWISQVGSLLDFNPEAINYYDRFVIPEEDGNKLILYAVNKSVNQNCKVIHYVQDIENPNKWKKEFTISSEKKFKYYFVDQILGFSVYGFNENENLGEEVSHPNISGIPFNGEIYVYGIVNVFHQRNKYNLDFKNVKDIYGKEVQYGDLLGKHLPNLGKNNIPDDVDKDYTFDGWYNSMATDVEKIPPQTLMPAHSYIAFAHWKSPSYQVNLHYKNNPNDSNWTTKVISVDKYDTSKSNKDFKLALENSELVTNANYKFKHWYYDSDFEQSFNTSDPIIKNVDLYADYSQIGGEKNVKIRSVCGVDSTGRSIYFQVDKLGNIEYEADGKTPKTTTDELNPRSYYNIKGSFGKNINLVPKVVFGYKPQEDIVLVEFDEDTDEVVIYYDLVNTWNYNIQYFLKTSSGDVLMQSSKKATYLEQVVEIPPRFSGFKLKAGSPKYAIAKEGNNSLKFYYELDTKYKFTVSGDYIFASNNYGTIAYDGKPHKLSLNGIDKDIFPDNTKLKVTYYRSSNNTKVSVPTDKGDYYATIELSLKDIQIWQGQVELVIQ